jgi:hypothetical protein
MNFSILFTIDAKHQYQELEKNRAYAKKFKAVKKAVALLESNPRHPGLNTHKYSSLNGPYGADIFEAYAENKTPGAYRIFWHYGPSKNVITIVAITPHP